MSEGVVADVADRLWQAEIDRSPISPITGTYIVDSRIADWKIRLVDTVADNAASAKLVIGGKLTAVTDFDLGLGGMVMTATARSSTRAPAPRLWATRPNVVSRLPTAVGDAVAVHHMTILGFSYDHRAFDGAPGPASWPSSATRCRTVTGKPSSARGGGRMLRVGLTGGIGSGKSEVSRRFAAHGAVIIDADVAAREVVGPATPGLAQVAVAFGAEVLGPDGTLDRERLGAMVFRDPALRAKLNAIVHPLVREWMGASERAAADAAHGDLIVVHDVPLLAESGLADGFDLVIVVDVPPELQVERLVSERGITPDQARARMAAQASRDQRLAIADLVIDNSGSLDDLDRRVAEVWADLQRRVR